MNIYLHVEVKTRDLPGRILLGMNAAKQGHDVYLGDQELLELVSKKKLNPGIILEKSITPTKNRVQLLKNLKKTKSIITSIDEEGGLLLENIETFLSERMSKKTLKLINNNFFWGNYDFRYAKKIFKEFKKKFVVTGNPRVELWNKRYKRTISNNLGVKNYVLISSNFKVGLSAKRFSEIYKFHLENSLFNKKKYRNFFNNHFAYTFNILLNFVFLINFLTQKMPNINFVVRPHPSESESNWKNFLIPSKNLIISKKYSHSDWIENSSVVLHNGCTGGVEAFKRNKNIICFRPFNSKYEINFPNQFSLICKNENEVYKQIKKIYEKRKIIKKPSKKMKAFYVKRFNDGEKESFCKNIVNIWNSYDNNYLSKTNNLNRVKLKGLVRNYKSKIMNQPENFKFPSLKKNELSNLINGIKLCNPELKNVQFDIINQRLLRLKLI